MEGFADHRAKTNREYPPSHRTGQIRYRSAWLIEGLTLTMELLLLALAIVAGFIVLAWSADRFVVGASAIAGHFGVSSMLIGLTVVGIGTSLPEMLVSAMAAIDATPGLALGNALGSNVANVGLILGATALITPLAMHSQVLRREFPLLIAVVLASCSPPVCYYLTLSSRGPKALGYYSEWWAY
jgi:Ca2+/Na+ antiporter